MKEGWRIGRHGGAGRSAAATLVGVSAALACDPSGDTRVGRPFDIALDSIVTVVSGESGLLSYVADMAVSVDGTLWIADLRAKRVVVVSQGGTSTRVFGHEGDGPGELRQPVAISLYHDTVAVYDAALNRLHFYRPDGSHIVDHLLRIENIGRAALGRRWTLMTPTLGRDSSLAVIHGVQDGTMVRLGPPVFPSLPMTTPRDMKAQAIKGEVPEVFRNVADVIPSPAGGAWLLVQSEAEVRKYTPAGGLEWSSVLSVPEVQLARTEFVRLNRAEPNPEAIYPLEMFADAEEVEGNLWVLMRNPEGSVMSLYVIAGETGEILGRVAMALRTTAGKMAVDVGRRLMYLALPNEASVVVIDVKAVPAWAAAGS